MSREPPPPLPHGKDIQNYPFFSDKEILDLARPPAPVGTQKLSSYKETLD